MKQPIRSALTLSLFAFLCVGTDSLSAEDRQEALSAAQLDALAGAVKETTAARRAQIRQLFAAARRRSGTSTPSQRKSRLAQMKQLRAELTEIEAGRLYILPRLDPPGVQPAGAREWDAWQWPPKIGDVGAIKCRVTVFQVIGTHEALLEHPNDGGKNFHVRNLETRGMADDAKVQLTTHIFLYDQTFTYQNVVGSSVSVPSLVAVPVEAVAKKLSAKLGCQPDQIKMP